jgi:hypothetical protein
LLAALISLTGKTVLSIKNIRSSVPISTAAVAIILLLVANASLLGQKNLSRESKLDPHASDALAVAEFCRTASKQPDIALLGSSLVAVASVQAAAIAAEKPVDRLTHRQSESFDRALHANLGMNASTVSLALGGAMASDAYLLTKYVLNSKQSPRAIIYGISVRDFQDNMMFGVETSEAFKLFHGADDLPDVWQLPHVTPDTKLSLTLSSVSPLWENRDTLSKQLMVAALKPASDTFPFFAKSKSAAGTPSIKIDGPLAPGESVSHPSADHMKEAYLMRYNPIAPDQIKTQFRYFNHLLELCNRYHVPILIVNMPITDANLAIMPPQLYQYYITETKRLCKQNSVEFQDLNQRPLNQPSNFLETVHLNPQGSTAFFDALAKTVGTSAIAQALPGTAHYAAVSKPGSL